MVMVEGSFESAFLKNKVYKDVHFNDSSHLRLLS